MRKRRSKSRIYWRERGGRSRAYADFRDFADVGGKREALIPPGSPRATSDPDVASKLVTDRLAELQQRGREKALTGVEQQISLAEFASYHLVQKAESGRVTRGWLVESENQLSVAIEFFGAGRHLTSIRVPDVQGFANHLRERSNGRGGTLSGGTIRHYLNTLSNLFRRAESESRVPPGFNPVSALLEKPSARPQRAAWLEVHEAALYLEATRLFGGSYAIPMYPIVATFLLTGGRKSEVLGLEVDDLSLDRKTISFRPNQFRRLKTLTSDRSVPLWPQLEGILTQHLQETTPERLLFPSPTSQQRMISNLRKALDGVAARAGWNVGEIRTKMFRHTYCAARLQTLDQGYPVSQYTVTTEMGHSGTALVDRVYGHLGVVRHRSEEVEYRVEQHEDILRDRLSRLGTPRRLEMVGALTSARDNS